MDIGELAEGLLERVAPGDALFERLIAVGEPVAAVIDLLEQAAAARIPVGIDLLNAVDALLLDSETLDEIDTSSVTEDLAALRLLARGA